MNCKPGDLAIIHSIPGYAGKKFNGRIVEIIYAAPGVDIVFELPDGTSGLQLDPGLSWVIKFIGGPASVPVRHGLLFAYKLMPYGICPDDNLRPLPGEPDEPYVEREPRVLKPTVGSTNHRYWTD